MDFVVFFAGTVLVGLLVGVVFFFLVGVVVVFFVADFVWLWCVGASLALDRWATLGRGDFIGELRLTGLAAGLVCSFSFAFQTLYCCWTEAVVGLLYRRSNTAPPFLGVVVDMVETRATTTSNDQLVCVECDDGGPVPRAPARGTRSKGRSFWIPGSHDENCSLHHITMEAYNPFLTSTRSRTDRRTKNTGSLQPRKRNRAGWEARPDRVYVFYQLHIWLPNNDVLFFGT